MFGGALGEENHAKFSRLGHVKIWILASNC